MAKPRTAGDYEEDVTAASRVGLAEIMTVLGAYRESLVLIGGWAPYLIIDFVVDPAVIDADRYATIVESLLDRDYEPVKDSLYRSHRLRGEGCLRHLCRVRALSRRSDCDS